MTIGNGWAVDYNIKDTYDTVVALKKNKLIAFDVLHERKTLIILHE